MNVNWMTQLKFELQKGDVNFPVLLCRMNKLAHINRIPLISYWFGCICMPKSSGLFVFLCLIN
jgi:hypothetical protein